MAQLKDFAEHEFGLAKPHSGGGNHRQHLESIKRQTGRDPKGLIGPKRPAGSEMVWRMFCDLSSGRHWTDFGQPLAISYGEIEAWASVNRYQVSLNDLTLLQLLDASYRRIMVVKDQSSGDDDDWDAP